MRDLLHPKQHPLVVIVDNVHQGEHFWRHWGHYGSHAAGQAPAHTRSVGQIMVCQIESVVSQIKSVACKSME